MHYREYLKTRGNDVDALNQLGTALGSSGKLDEAISAFRRAAEIDPTDGAVQRNLASTLLGKRHFDEAAEHAEEAVALQSADAGSCDVLGRVLEQEHRFDEAAAEFARALQLDPTFADARDDLQRLRQFRTTGSSPPRMSGGAAAR